MRGNIAMRGLFALILIAVLVGAGVYVYNAGVTQGALSGAEGIGVPVGRVAHYYYQPFGFGGFCLMFLFLWFVVGGIFRIFGFKRMGWRKHRGRWGKEIPSQVEEWHRRMHDSESESESESSEQSSQSSEA